MSDEMSGQIFKVLSHCDLGCSNWSPAAMSKFVKIIEQIFDIENTIKQYNLTTKLKSKYGLHYKECCWSEDDTVCGPGECVCKRIRRNKYNITCLLEEMVALVREGNPFD
jgi:hypothetical protein